MVEAQFEMLNALSNCRTRRGMPCRPAMNIDPKVSWNPKNAVQKPMDPMRSFRIRPVILGNQ